MPPPRKARDLPAAAASRVPALSTVSCRGTASALLPEWKGFPLRAELEQVAGVPVAIDSVGRAFAVG